MDKIMEKIMKRYWNKEKLPSVGQVFIDVGMLVGTIMRKDEEIKAFEGLCARQKFDLIALKLEANNGTKQAGRTSNPPVSSTGKS